MSTPRALIALVFDDPYKADEARAVLLRMEGEGLLTIDETAVVSRKTEKEVRMTQDANLAQKGKGIGELVGTVASSIFPLARPLGALLGSRIADVLDKGISNDFIKGVRKELKDETSVLILVVGDSRQHTAKILDRLDDFGPKLLKSELSPELEAGLKAALLERAEASSAEAVRVGG